MDLNEWNRLQCTVFEFCDINIDHCLDAYRYMSYLSKYRTCKCSQETLEKMILDTNNLKLEK